MVKTSSGWAHCTSQVATFPCSDVTTYFSRGNFPLDLSVLLRSTALHCVSTSFLLHSEVNLLHSKHAGSHHRALFVPKALPTELLASLWSTLTSPIPCPFQTHYLGLRGWLVSTPIELASHTRSVLPVHCPAPLASPAPHTLEAGGKWYCNNASHQLSTADWGSASEDQGDNVKILNANASLGKVLRAQHRNLIIQEGQGWKCSGNTVR